jgi:hypothetical protein
LLRIILIVKFLAKHNLAFCGSNSVGVLYPWYTGSSVTAQKFGYGRFPPAANGWKTKYHIPDMIPALLYEEEGPST